MMPEILRKSFLDNFMDDVGSWDGAKLGHQALTTSHESIRKLSENLNSVNEHGRTVTV